MSLITLLEARKKKKKRAKKPELLNPIVMNPDDTAYQRPIREGVESDHAFLVWGRFQGVTKAHTKLLEHAASVSKEAGAHLYIATSNTHDKKKNIFSPDLKHKMLEAVIVSHKIPAYVIVKEKSNNIVEVLSTLSESGYTRVTLVIGPDRVNDYDSLIESVENNSIEGLKRLELLTYDDNTREQISASILRAALQENDFELVKQVADPSVLSILKTNVLKEDKEVHHSAKIQHKINASLTIRPYLTVLARARKIETQKTAPQAILYKRARRAAIRVVREKVAGTLGKRYEQLPYATRVQIDRNVRKRGSLINTIAMSLIPRARRLDVLRHQKRAKEQEISISRKLKNSKRETKRELNDTEHKSRDDYRSRLNHH